jgi:hypothetical protein
MCTRQAWAGADAGLESRMQRAGLYWDEPLGEGCILFLFPFREWVGR